jgi:uncharacterized membrane protein YjdF
MFSIMGLPVLAEFGIVVSLSIILRKYIFHNSEFYEWLKSKLQEALAASANHFDSEWFFPRYRHTVLHLHLNRKVACPPLLS